MQGEGLPSEEGRRARMRNRWEADTGHFRSVRRFGGEPGLTASMYKRTFCMSAEKIEVGWLRHVYDVRGSAHQ